MDAMGGTYRLKSVQFRREREAAWRELEEILAKTERRGLAALSDDELYRLPSLYRGAVSSLSVARSISLDRALVDYLENLAARAYVHVYGAKRSYLAAVGRFFVSTFPGAVWRLRAAVAAAVLVMVAGGVTGFRLTLADPDLFYAFMPEEMAAGREPASSREELLTVLRNEERRGPFGGAERSEEGGGEGAGGEAGGGGEEAEANPAAGLTFFAGQLFTHNTRVGMYAFALGFAAAVPSLLVLFSNGLTLGAFAAIHHRQGLSVELWGWLLPHGVTELLAICLCGAAGIRVGWALVFPGRLTRLDALADAGRRAAVVVLGTVAMFLLAGLIEGYFRQLVSTDAPRYALAASTGVLWLAYFSILGRRGAAAEAAEEAGR